MASDFIGACMIIILFLMLLSSIILFIIYITGGDFGHLNAFYFSLIFLTFFDGFTNAFAFCINAPNSSLLSAGIPLSGALVTLLHNVYKFFSDLYNLDDFDYYVLGIQLLINILTILVTFILWIVDFALNYEKGGHNKLSEGNPLNLFYTTKPEENNILDWSPIFMLAISLGTVYAFYPSIAPYSIIDFQYASVIELWILIISSLLPLLFALLDLTTVIVHMNPTNNTTKAYGPSGLILVLWNSSADITGGDCGGTQSSNVKFGTGGKKHEIRHNWVPGRSASGSSNPYAFWNLVWICAIFYILCIQIFMSLLHYPQCLLSCFFNKPLLIGFISVLFNTLREVMQACGFAGAGKQVKVNPSGTIGSKISCSQSNHSDNCNKIRNQYKWSTDPDDSTGKQTRVDGVIAPCNKLITLFVMMFCVFTGDGYLQHYRRCCRDCWPTTGYNKYQSFFYWLHFGFKGGIKFITSSFTDLYYHNLRPQFISYA